jgi:uncharacterized membrane protein YedE/YeeE
MIELIKQAWHWAVAGILIGLTVLILLLMRNKKLGISSSLRHLCAMCIPTNIPFFKYCWKKEIWNLFFVVGVFKGLFFFVTGGFMVDFGTRYAGGCTSGHAIMGLSNFQMPSLIATCCFIVGGFFSADILMLLIFKLF